VKPRLGFAIVHLLFAPHLGSDSYGGRIWFPGDCWGMTDMKGKLGSLWEYGIIMGLPWDYGIIVNLLWDMNEIIMRFNGNISPKSIN
jgi:hypothetical protein